MKKENDLLEETLSIAENGYAEAYRFLQEEYEKNLFTYQSKREEFSSLIESQLSTWQTELNNYQNQ